MTISKDSPDVSVIEDRVLSCGVRLLVEPNPSVKSAAVSWWVPAGTMNDPEGDEAVSYTHLTLPTTPYV